MDLYAFHLISLFFLYEATCSGKPMGKETPNDGRTFLKCSTCFASCIRLELCHEKCLELPSSYCHGQYCDIRTDYYSVGAFYTVRRGCTNRPVTLDNAQSMRYSYSSDPNHFDRTDDVERGRPDVKESAQKWCYSAGTSQTPTEYCTCGNSDWCNLQPQPLAPRLAIGKSDQCCVVAPEMLPLKWLNACPSTCHGSHCITDLVGNRKTCGMDIATSRPDVLPGFDAVNIPANQQYCFMYETSGRHELINQCFCKGEYCNENVAKPDYRQLQTGESLPTFKCLSCRLSGASFDFMSTNMTCSNTCHGHYCLIALQTTQLVQYYDEDKNEILLPKLESDHFDLHAGCVRVTHPSLVQNGGCQMNWMHNEQPTMSRCSCIGDECNTVGLLRKHIMETFATTQPQSTASSGSGPEPAPTSSLIRKSTHSTVSSNEQQQQPGPSVSAVPTTLPTKSQTTEFDMGEDPESQSESHNQRVPEDDTFAPMNPSSSFPVSPDSASADTESWTKNAGNVDEGGTLETPRAKKNLKPATQHDLVGSTDRSSDAGATWETGYSEPSVKRRASPLVNLVGILNAKAELRGTEDSPEDHPEDNPQDSSDKTGSIENAESYDDDQWAYPDSSSENLANIITFNPQGKASEDLLKEIKDRNLFQGTNPGDPKLVFGRLNNSTDKNVNYSPFFPVPDQKPDPEREQSGRGAAERSPTLCSFQIFLFIVLYNVLK